RAHLQIADFKTNQIASSHIVEVRPSGASTMTGPFPVLHHREYSVRDRCRIWPAAIPTRRAVVSHLSSRHFLPASGRRQEFFLQPFNRATAAIIAEATLLLSSSERRREGIALSALLASMNSLWLFASSYRRMTSAAESAAGRTLMTPSRRARLRC